MHDIRNGFLLDKRGCHFISGEPQLTENELEPEFEHLVDDNKVEFVLRDVGVVFIESTLQGEEFIKMEIIPVRDGMA